MEFIILVVAIVILLLFVYVKKYDAWFYKRMARKKDKLELKILEQGLVERQTQTRLSFLDKQAQWEYNTKMLEVVKAKVDDAAIHQLNINKTEVLKQLAEIEALRLKSLDPVVEQHKAALALQESSNKLNSIYEQLQQNDSMRK